MSDSAKYHGQLTAELAISQVMAHVQTGDLHVYVADLVGMQLYYSRARSDGETDGPAMGYDRQYIKLDLNVMFAVGPTPPPAQPAAKPTPDVAEPVIAIM